MKKEILTRPFAPEQIRQRPGQHGKTLSYVDVSAVIERLNEAFEHRWNFEVVQHEVHEGEVVVLGKLTADRVTKSAFGGSAVTIDQKGQIVSIADDLKAAASDALKKAASMLGIGLEIYSGAVAAEPNAGPQQRGAPASGAAPTPVGDRLTARQLAAIHATARRDGMARDALLSLVAGRTGKDRIELLTRAEASSILDSLTASGADGAHR